jgi:hypothetical protein
MGLVLNRRGCLLCSPKVDRPLSADVPELSAPRPDCFSRSGHGAGRPRCSVTEPLLIKPANRRKLPTRRFLRWATPLLSPEQIVVSGVGASFKQNCDDHRKTRSVRARRATKKELSAEQALTFVVGNIVGTGLGESFFVSMTYASGALGGTRTPTILLTATSRQRVYQFRHERLGYRLEGLASAGSTAPM